MIASLALIADATTDAAGVFAGIGIVGLLIAAITSLFWLWMLIDALTNTALDTTQKLIWVLVIFFLHVLGAVIYFFVGRRPGTKPTAT